MKTASKATVLLSFVTLGLFSASPAQADLKDELRERLHSMEEKARRLKEEGKTEEFEKMKQEMKEFAQKARQKHAEQLKAEQMKAEAKDKDKGKEKESEEKAERREKQKNDSDEKAEHHEKENKQAQEQAAHERKMMLHREEMERRKMQGHDKKDQEVADARMNHLKQAAEHLRAAGKQELAHQILQEGLDNHRKHQAHHKPAKEDRSAPLSPELAERIGSQFKEMHEALRHLNQRLERLEKASKE